VLLVLFECTLKALPTKVLQNTFFLFAVSHSAKKHAVFIFLQSIGTVILVNAGLIEKDSFVVAIVFHVLLLTPLRTGLFILEVVEVDLPLQETLHLQLYRFQRIEK
jgi:hypothetical protein